MSEQYCGNCRWLHPSGRWCKATNQPTTRRGLPCERYVRARVLEGRACSTNRCPRGHEAGKEHPVVDEVCGRLIRKCVACGVLYWVPEPKPEPKKKEVELPIESVRCPHCHEEFPIWLFDLPKCPNCDYWWHYSPPLPTMLP